MNSRREHHCPVPRRRRIHLSPDPRRRRQAGTVTLEWLLVIAAAGGFAAAMVAGLDGLTAGHTAFTHREHSTHAASRTAAARIDDRALAALIDHSTAQAGGTSEAADTAAARLERLRHECETLPAAYPAAVQHARWHWQPIPALTDSGTDSQSPAGTPEPPTPPLSDERPDPAAAPRQPDEPGRTAAEGRWTCRLDAPAR